ncbi:MAG TPA: phosphohistidine phosphatase SixA [Candidatus Binatia bacterium]|nr:phosphohistidine phosphatase SixA [Candidatus Binatia bacterium]
MAERRIFVVRHAIAEDRAASGRDADRALTREGRKKMKRAARGLAVLEVRPAAILTSPLVRARETAEILAAELNVPIELCPPLASGADPREVAAVVEQRSPDDALMLVGHEPDLGQIVAAWLTGSRDGLAVRFRKGAVACLMAGMLPPEGRATLDWFLTADQLGAMGDG